MMHYSEHIQPTSTPWLDDYCPQMLDLVAKRYGDHVLDDTHVLDSFKRLWLTKTRNIFEQFDRTYSIHHPDITVLNCPEASVLSKAIDAMSGNERGRTTRNLARNFIHFASRYAISPHEWFNTSLERHQKSSRYYLSVPNINYCRENGYGPSRIIFLQSINRDEHDSIDEHLALLSEALGCIKSADKIVSRCTKVIEKANKTHWPNMPFYNIEYFRRRTIAYHAQYLNPWELAAIAGSSYGAQHLRTMNDSQKKSVYSKPKPGEILMRGSNRDQELLYKAWASPPPNRKSRYSFEHVSLGCS